MLARERRETIANLIIAEGKVTVSDLVKRFGVTEDCIRKDLRALAAEGRCRRVYGGAIGSAATSERDVLSRMAEHVPEKQLMAQKAAALIPQGGVIFLDISSTNVYLAERIAQDGLSCMVVSNMLDILKALVHAPHARAIGLPGIVDSELGGLLGAQTLTAIAEMHFDAAFLGARGVNIERDAVTTFEADDGLVKRTAMQNSQTTYLMAEAGKFESSGLYNYAQLSAFNGVVGDDKLDAATTAQLESLGLRVI